MLKKNQIHTSSLYEINLDDVRGGNGTNLSPFEHVIDGLSPIPGKPDHELFPNPPMPHIDLTWDDVK